MITLLSILALIFAVLQIILFFKIWGMTNDIRIMKQNMRGVEYDFNHYMLLDEKEKAFNLVKSRLLNVLMIKKEGNNDKTSFIENSKWQDVIMFRFFRSTGATGELILRDFHAKLKDTKAGKGFCITAGTFTPEAKHFVEARLIDLIEKEKLNVILNKVDTNKPETMQ